MPKVVGRIKEIVHRGPIPGRMPTNVPKKQPMKAQKIFVGVSATVNPSIIE